MKNSFNERRKNLRIYRNFILTYREKGKSMAKHHVSQVSNVSKGGMKFLTTHPLRTELHIVIDMKTPFLADTIRLEGLVLDCREKIPDLIYEIRLQFLEVPQYVLAVLDKIESYAKA